MVGIRLVPILWWFLFTEIWCYAVLLGLWLGRVQSGQVNTYALALVVGVLLLLGGAILSQFLRRRRSG